MGHSGGLLIGFSLGASSHVACSHACCEDEGVVESLVPRLSLPFLGQAGLAFRSQMESKDLRVMFRFLSHCKSH